VRKQNKKSLTILYMYLPNELFYIILSFRETHPVAKLIAEAVKNDDAYFNQKSEKT
jgi:hypothetical protein